MSHQPDPPSSGSGKSQLMRLDVDLHSEDKYAYVGDHFKAFNDRYAGHSGSQVLITWSGRSWYVAGVEHGNIQIVTDADIDAFLVDTNKTPKPPEPPPKPKRIDLEPRRGFRF